MPMYEFQCRGCGQRFEKLLWREPDASVSCACGSTRTERILYSRVAVAAGHSEGGDFGGDMAMDSGEACGDGNGEGCCGGGCEADWN